VNSNPTQEAKMAKAAKTEKPGTSKGGKSAGGKGRKTK